MQILTPEYTKAGPSPSPGNFEGQVVLQTLARGDAEDLEVLAVWFEHGARNIPHTHPTDQLLVVMSGTCVVATKGRRELLGAGESAMIPAGEWHWHGAATRQTAMHLSIKKRGATNWDQPREDFDDWTPAETV